MACCPLVIMATPRITKKATAPSVAKRMVFLLLCWSSILRIQRRRVVERNAPGSMVVPPPVGAQSFSLFGESGWSAEQKRAAQQKLPPGQHVEEVPLA